MNVLNFPTCQGDKIIIQLRFVCLLTWGCLGDKTKKVAEEDEGKVKNIRKYEIQCEALSGDSINGGESIF